MGRPGGEGSRDSQADHWPGDPEHPATEPGYPKAPEMCVVTRRW